MSSSIWTRCAGDSRLRELRLSPWRVVEAQHRISTRKLVDSADEQEVLEDLRTRRGADTAGNHHVFEDHRDAQQRAVFAALDALIGLVRLLFGVLAGHRQQAFDGRLVEGLDAVDMGARHVERGHLLRPQQVAQGGNRQPGQL